MENNCKYKVAIRRDTKMMKTFIKFKNRVRHPRVSFNMFLVGVMLVALPIINSGIKLPGMIISYAMGTLLVLMALFRHYISLSMMKKNPEVIENEEITYIFGNTGIKVEKGESLEHLGNYKKIYCVWEDEKCFYAGMNEEDLLILPKENFVEGDAGTFRDFILDKSRAEYSWKPADIRNICRQKLMQIKMRMSEQNENPEGQKEADKK